MPFGPIEVLVDQCGELSSEILPVPKVSITLIGRATPMA